MANDLILNDRYNIQEEIGRGGMGVVYRAEDTLLERPVAIKLVSDSNLGTEGRPRILQEARAAARLNHPNIVAVYDVGQTTMPNRDGLSSYIVMEFVEGHTLRDYQPKSLQETVDITTKVCGALEFAHDQGIIHRDLKPENVSLTFTDTVKLMDFGLARVVGKTRLTDKGTFMGTLSYLAPEIILGQEATAKSDLYALGVMLYELSAGRHPFEGADLTEVISQHLYAPVVPPSAYNEQISPTLDRLIVSLLNKRPEERPESAGAVQTALKDLSKDGLTSQVTYPVPELDRLVRGRMIGRESEFAEAVNLWQRASAGNGRLLLISGEPGIGKTRLVRELSTYAEISGGHTLIGLCYAEERTPYGPIAQVVQTSLEQGSLENGFQLDLPPEVLGDLVTLVPELRLNYPDLPTNALLDPESKQQRLFQSIVTWFGALTQQRQLLLVLEDVHWADSGSLSLLRHLARRLGNRRALLVATYREVELDESLPFQDMLNDWNRDRLADRIKLSRLTKDQTRDLLATLFAEEITSEFLEGIFRETEGNPFFIQEVCKALVDSGELYFADGSWQRPAFEQMQIPQSIRVTIQSRLGKLTKDEQFALQKAALLGRDFEYEMLLGITDLDEDGLIDVLEKAEQAQLIEEIYSSLVGASARFTFTHALIYSTLLSNLSTLRRQRLQRQVAQSLEEAFPQRRDELASLLGRYFAEAGEGEKAVPYLLQAGDAARRIFAYDEAIQAFEQALLFLREQSNHQLAARTLMKLGLAYHSTFAFEESRQAYEEGLLEWRKSGESRRKRSLSPAPHPLRFVERQAPESLDVAVASDTVSHLFISQLFGGLLELTGDDEVVPDIAQSWDVLDDGRRYIFHLRDNAIWSDGVLVTAGDFEYSWKRSLHPEMTQGLAKLLYDIKGARSYHQGFSTDPETIGVRAEDDFTLKIDLESPSSYFLQILAHTVTRPIPKHVVVRLESSWNEPRHIVTNGPFQIKEWSPEKLILLEKDPNHSGNFQGNVSQLQIQLRPADSWMGLYERNELDFVYPYATTVQEFNHLIHSYADDHISLPYPAAGILGFDVSCPPFEDVRVRQALVLAIDRQGVVSRRAKGVFPPATGGLVPSGIPGHVPGIALPFDPELARQKLAAAGYPDGIGFPKVEILMTIGMEFGGIFERFAEQWQENLGLEVSYEAYEQNEFLARRRTGKYKAWISGWHADYPDPDSFLRVYMSTVPSNWLHPEYESFIQNARQISDSAQRMALYRQAERILVQEAPVVPLTYGGNHFLVKPWISSLPYSTFNGVIAKDVVIEHHD